MRKGNKQNEEERGRKEDETDQICVNGERI
jgi:hypothetical protein